MVNKKNAKQRHCPASGSMTMLSSYKLARVSTELTVWRHFQDPNIDWAWEWRSEAELEKGPFLFIQWTQWERMTLVLQGQLTCLGFCSELCRSYQRCWTLPTLNSFNALDSSFKAQTKTQSWLTVAVKIRVPSLQSLDNSSWDPPPSMAPWSCNWKKPCSWDLAWRQSHQRRDAMNL